MSESSVSSRTDKSPLDGPGGGEVDEVEDGDDPTAEVCYLDPDTDADAIWDWELDFCSGPTLDARGKKVWELVVCDGTYKREIGRSLAEKIRFFRSYMQTIITKACNELGVKPVSIQREEVSSSERTYVFSANLDLEHLGLEIEDEALVPGLAVASSRAKPLAGYIHVTYKKTSATTKEAEAWEAAKKTCGGLHLLAIQENLNSDDRVGFWILLDLPPPPV